jgi:hypothetical protein
MGHPYYDRCQTVELTEYSNALSRNEGTRSTRQKLCRTPSCICSDRMRQTLCFCLKVSSRPRSAGISHTDASAELQQLPALNTLGAPGRRPPVLVGRHRKITHQRLSVRRANTLFSPSNWPLPSPRLWPLVVREIPELLELNTSVVSTSHQSGSPVIDVSKAVQRRVRAFHKIAVRVCVGKSVVRTVIPIFAFPAAYGHVGLLSSNFALGSLLCHRFVCPVT